MQVPVWGWSAPGTEVTVSFAGQTEMAKAGEDGRWMLRLAPLEASFEPRKMVIATSDGEKEILTNILVGEVWMASGQSNMQWKAVPLHDALLRRLLKERICIRPDALKKLAHIFIFCKLLPKLFLQLFGED